MHPNAVYLKNWKWTEADKLRDIPESWVVDRGQKFFSHMYINISDQHNVIDTHVAMLYAILCNFKFFIETTIIWLRL